MRRIRLASVPLTALALTLAAPASAPAPPAQLTGAERKAMDVVSVEAGATDNAALITVAFKGKLEQRLGLENLKKAGVTISVVPASGPTTVFTDSGKDAKPKVTRTGTEGEFELVRDGREISLFVGGLPAQIRQVAVATSGPVNARAPARADHTYDELVQDFPTDLVSCETLRQKLDDARKDSQIFDGFLAGLQIRINGHDKDIAEATEELRGAEGAKADALRKKLEKLKKERAADEKQVKDVNNRRRGLDKWIEKLQNAIERDCGGGTTTPPPPPPPANPQCSDGVDNDSDGQIDHPNDTGCLSAPDTTEATTTWPFPYPGDAFSIEAFLDFKPFFGPFAGEVLSYLVFFNPPVHSSNTPNHGATPINGTMPCADLGATGIRAGIGSQAPVGGSLPAAPDSDHMRIVISTSDPAGGGTCGTGTVNLEVATDTRAP